jgi:hypothetical protein
MDKFDPHFARALSDIEDPRSIRSSTLIAELQRFLHSNETELPTDATDRTLNEDPRFRNSNKEVLHDAT